MTDQITKAKNFHQLHSKGSFLILPNAWDVGSAKAIEAGGAKAIATSSWAVAQANGYDDGENTPFDLVIANLHRIVHAVDSPVSIDIETGYSQTAEGVAKTVEQVINAGAIGINMEDQNLYEESKLYSVDEQAQRLRYARQAAEDLSIPLFINARADVFFQSSPSDDKETLLAEVLERVEAYAKAGANSLFVPGLKDLECIKVLCQQSPLPINLMLTEFDKEAVKQYRQLGVVRLSLGPLLYRESIAHLTHLSQQALNF